ncbi:MAG: efflux RND transporter periplasmic adaptor subunit [Longimicrobiales bacterium]
MTRTRKVAYFGVGAGVAVLSLAAVLVLAPGVGRGAPQDQKPEQPMQGMDMGGAEGMEGMDMGGMDMSGMSSDGTIRLTADEIGTFGITFGTVDMRPLTKTIRTVGLVEFDEARKAYVSPKFGGWAEKLYVDFTGQPVARGQPLLDVYSPELVTAQEELLLAARLTDSVQSSPVESVVSGARDLRESAMRRLRYWDISEAQIQQLLETGQVRRTLTLHAPVSGIVMEKDVFEGQAFQPGANLYMIAGLTEVWVNAEVFEADAALVHEGMTAEITVAALPGQSFTGRIEYVYPTLEDQTRSMRARVSMPNPGGLLKPGMYATVKFGAELGESLTVPASAVLHSGERAVAFVDMAGGEIMPHELTLGVRAGEYVQVLDGLEPGQRVVTSAQYLLDSESNLAEVMKAMMAQMNVSDMGGMEGMEGMEMDRKD